MDLVARLRLQDDLSGRMRKVNSSLAGVEKRTRGLSSGFAKLGGVMAGLGVSVGMAAIGKSVVQTGVDFTTTMSKVQAVSGATGEEMEKLTAQARDLGKTTIHSATQAADAQAFLGQAGFKTNEILATMPGLLDLATAGQLDLGRAADIASNVMTGFNLKATEMGRIADVLAQSAANANTDVEQMGMAMSYIAPIASAMGVSLEETAAGIGLLSNAGIQGERAGTALRGMIGALGDPTKALARQLNGVGLSVDDVNPKVNSLADIIENLTDSGLTAADAIELVGLNAGPGLAALMTAGADNIRSFTKDMENAGGAAKTMAAIISDNLEADIKLFDSAREEANLQIFDKFEDKIRGFIQGATKAVEKIPAVVDKIIALGVAAKPVVTAFMPLVKGILAFAAAVLAVEAVLGVIGAVAGLLAFLTGPVGLAAAAITGIVLGFQAFYKHSETFRGAVDMVVGGVSGLFKAFSGNNAGAMTAWLDSGFNTKQVQKLFDFSDAISETVSKVKTAIGNLSKMDAGQIATLFGMSDEGIAGVKATMESIKQAFVSFKKGLATGSVGGFMEALGFSPEAIASVEGTISSLLGVFESAKTAVSGFIESVSPSVSSLMETFRSFGTTLMEVFSAAWSLLAPVFDAIGVAIGIIGDVATMVFNNMIVPSVNYAIQMFQLLWKVVGPILELLGAAIKVAFTVLKTVWDNILSPFLSFMTGAFKAGLELATPVIDAVGGAFDKVGSFVSGLAGMVRDFADALKNVKIPDWVSTLGGKLGGLAKSVGNVFSGGGKVAIPGHYHGIDRIPTNNYLANLHKGERVLTRQEADSYEGMDYATASAGVSNDNRTYNYETTTASSGDSGMAKSYGVNVTGNTFHVRQESDIEDIAKQLYEQIAIAAMGGA